VEKQELIEVDEESEQRRDALLLKLLKTPPQPRPKRDRSHDKEATSQPSSASEGRPSPSA